MKQEPVINSRSEGDSEIVSFNVDRINEYRLAERFSRDLKSLVLEKEFDKLILDCGNLDYVVSEVFTVLLQVSNLIKRKKRKMYVCNLTPFLNDIYATMRFEAVIPVCKTLEDALKV